jgi:hypothetical protein
MVGAYRGRSRTSKERREDDKRAEYRQDDHEDAIREPDERRKDDECAENKKDCFSFHHG